MSDSIKVYYPHYKTGIRYSFTLQCPNLDNQLSLSLLHDATVTGDIHYYDVCKVADSVTIAYNNFNFDFQKIFAVSHETKTMVEYPGKVQGFSFIAFDWEIIKAFLDHHSLTPTWIHCNQVWGWLDEETGNWTGAVGKVKNCTFFLFLLKLYRLRGMRQTGQCLFLPAPMVGVRLLCVLMLSHLCLTIGGQDTPQSQLSIGT